MAIYDTNKNPVFLHDCKIEALKETIENLNGSPVLIFNAFKHDVPRIEKVLNSLKLDYRILQNMVDVDLWNNKKINALIAHPASAGFGLNLQEGGNHIIWFGLPWSLELYQQANKRLHRQGQKSTVFIHRLIVENGMDEDVIKALGSKENAQEVLLMRLKAKAEAIHAF